jgi:hypothetical protein
VEIIIENHWGASRSPENLARILDAVDGLGLLFDTQNFPPDRKEACWQRFAPHARSVHVKTFEFNAQGNDPTVDIPAVRTPTAGYTGCWGIESVPRDGDNTARSGRRWRSSGARWTA